jgi:hypothetical protein
MDAWYLLPEVLAIAVRNVEIKNLLEAEGPPKFVHDPHYDNYPAVLIRLADIELEELEDLLEQAWRAKAPATLQKQWVPCNEENSQT